MPGTGPRSVPYNRVTRFPRIIHAGTLVFGNPIISVSSCPVGPTVFPLDLLAIIPLTQRTHSEPFAILQNSVANCAARNLDGATTQSPRIITDRTEDYRA